jgi:hypothetical protein
VRDIRIIAYSCVSDRQRPKKRNLQFNRSKIFGGVSHVSLETTGTQVVLELKTYVSSVDEFLQCIFNYLWSRNCSTSTVTNKRYNFFDDVISLMCVFLLYFYIVINIEPLYFGAI